VAGKGGFEAGRAHEEEVRWLQIEARGGSQCHPKDISPYMVWDSHIGLKSPGRYPGLDNLAKCTEGGLGIGLGECSLGPSECRRWMHYCC